MSQYWARTCEELNSEGSLMIGYKFLSNGVLNNQTHQVFLVCSVCCCHGSVFCHNPFFVLEDILTGS